MASIKLSRYEAEEGDLPDVCMRCGAEATERKRRRFVSHPVWVYVLMPFGYIPYAIVAAILTEHILCYTLFCPRHKNYFLVRNLFVWGSLVVILALIIGGFFLALWLSGQPDKSSRGVVDTSSQDIVFGSFCFGTVLLLICWLISIPISQETAIHPGDASERHLTLKHVSPAFVEAVRQYRADRVMQNQAEDPGEGPRPRRSPRRRYEEDDEEFEEI